MSRTTLSLWALALLMPLLCSAQAGSVGPDLAQPVTGGEDQFTPNSGLEREQAKARVACSQLADVYFGFELLFEQYGCIVGLFALALNANAPSPSLRRATRSRLGAAVMGVGSERIAVATLASGADLVAWVSGNTLTTALVNGATPQTVGQYTVGPTASHVIAADLNGDGNVDLAVSNFGNTNDNSGGNVQIFLGKGDGTFAEGATINVGATPVSLAVADFNGDGKLDLVVANVTENNVSVLLGNGDGTFQDLTAISIAAKTPNCSLTGLCLAGPLIAADFNGDGRADLAVATANGGTLSVLLGNGNGTFATPVSYPAGIGHTAYLAWMDVNGDSALDLIAADPDPSGFSILFGNGDGSFQSPVEYVTGAMPGTFAVRPPENGAPALVITSDGISGDLVLTPISPTGIAAAPRQHRIPASPGMYPTGIAAADLNGDHLPDMVAANGSISVLLRNPGAEFEDPVSYPLQSGSQAASVAIADLNGDGNKDIIAAGSNSQGGTGGTVDVALGKGDGTLGQQHSYAIGGSAGGALSSPASGIAVGDFNGDGSPDVAAGFQNSRGASGSSGGGGISVLLGNGDGTLRPAVNYQADAAAVLSVVAADFNGDGKLDLAAGSGGSLFNYSTPGALMVLLGKGDGTFQNPASIQVGSPPGTPVALAAADINGDGKIDVVASVWDANLTDTILVLLGNGDGTFRQLAPFSPGAAGNAIAVTDLNGDGIPDLVVADCCGFSESVYLLGNGDGTFGSPHYFSSGSSITAFAVTDWNGKGVPGLAVTQDDGLGLPGSVMAMQSGLNPKLSGVNPLSNISAAGGVAALAPGSLAAGYGTDLATGTLTAQSTPWPTVLDGTSVNIVDSSGSSTAASVYFVSQGQVDYQIPNSVAAGPATVTITSGDGTKSLGQINVQAVAPALFTLNSANLAAASAVCVSSTGAQIVESVYQVVGGAIVPAPLNLAACSETVLLLFATGMDSVSGANVQVSIGGTNASVQYAGPQGVYAGLDQINVVIPQSLAGAGDVPIVLTASGQTANTVSITFR